MTQMDRSRPSADKSDWPDARPALIPRSTFWPSGVAFGITFFMWGLITSAVLIVVGLVTLIASVIGWIGELRHEERQS